MIRVTIFNEFIHEKYPGEARDVYPRGIHEALRENLADEEFSIRTVTLDDPDCGLTPEVLAETDVLLWWGHMAHHKVPDEVARRVQEAVLSGMGAIFLHSGHHSKPFRLLMGTPCSLSWRCDGDREYLWVCDPSHPIVQGIGRFLRLEHEETYCEPFSIPEPDKLVFLGSYEGGEAFRAGCCYRRGYGKVFYFQPGHETYPTYHQPEVVTVLKNAVRWTYSGFRRQIDCPHVERIPE